MDFKRRSIPVMKVRMITALKVSLTQGHPRVSLPAWQVVATAYILIGVDEALVRGGSASREYVSVVEEALLDDAQLRSICKWSYKHAKDLSEFSYQP